MCVCAWCESVWEGVKGMCVCGCDVTIFMCESVSVCAMYVCE